MDGKNPEARVLAFKSAKNKLAKIKELGIKAKMSDKAKNAIIKQLSVAKAETMNDGSTWQDHVDKQDWYVKHLIGISAMKTSQEVLDFEYMEHFADCASEAEMTDELDKLR